MFFLWQWQKIVCSRRRLLIDYFKSIMLTRVAIIQITFLFLKFLKSISEFFISITLLTQLIFRCRRFSLLFSRKLDVRLAHWKVKGGLLSKALRPGFHNCYSCSMKCVFNSNAKEKFSFSFQFLSYYNTYYKVILGFLDFRK